MGAVIAPAGHRRIELPHPARRWRAAGTTPRAAVVGAVGFIALLAAGMAVLAIDGVTGSPAADATDQEVADFFADHRLAHLINVHLASVAILVALPLFVVALSLLLRRLERADGDHLASSVVLAGGLVAVLPAFVQAVAWGAAAYEVADSSVGATRGLYDLGNIGFALMGYPLALLVVAASLGARRTGLLTPRATTIGLAVAVVVAISAAVYGAITVGFALFAVWSVAVAWILLGRTEGRSA